MMRLRVAPTALRSPISRVRSVTDTSMMFITPTPPSVSVTTAIAPEEAVMELKIPSTSSRVFDGVPDVHGAFVGGIEIVVPCPIALHLLPRRLPSAIE